MKVASSVRFGLIASAALLASPGAAQSAQETVDEAAEAPDQGATNNDILVTARRKQERLLDTPVAVTVLSGEQLARGGIADVEALRFVAPALQIAPSPFGKAVPGYTIRSQRSLESIITQDPAVGVYFGDVVQQRPHGTNAALYDLASVEVLKGPQGTLFGRNTTGGAVLINPAAPVFSTGVALDFELGNFDLRRATGMVNIPLGDKVAVRVAGRITRRDGFVENLFNGTRTDDERTDSYRASILFEPDDQFSSLFVFNYFRQDDAGSGFILGGLRPGSPFGANPAVAQSFARQQTRANFWSVENNFRPFTDVETFSISNISTLDLGSVTLKNIFGYRKVDSDVAFDYDATPASVFQSRNRLNTDQWTEEFQISGNATSRLNYIAGFYYFQETGRDTQDSLLFGTRSNDGEGRNISYSAYAQFGYDLTDRLSLTAGGRYTWDDRNLRAFNTINGQCRLVGPNGLPPNPCVAQFDASFSSPTWQISLDYKPGDDTLLYLAHRRGYRSGGWNLRANRISEQVFFRPETVDDIELGFKGRLFDNRLTVSAAAYHQWYTDIQRTLSFIPAPGEPLATVVLNAADATISGFELEATANPVPWLELGGSLAYTNPQYSDFVSPSGQDLSDNNFALAPEWTYTLRARVIAPIEPEQGELSAGVSYYYQSRTFVADLNVGPNIEVPIEAYGVMDASIEWNSISGSPFDLRFLVRNLTNEQYFTGGAGTFASLGTTSFILGAPRTYSINIGYRFGSAAR